jgi:hypothetical protein
MRRVLAASAGLVLLLVVSPASAHGVGGRQDLPFPLSYFVSGAAVALIISFMWIGISWTEPKMQTGPNYQKSRLSPLGRWAVVLQPVGIVGLLVVLVNPLVGDGFAPAFLVWVGLWLVVPFVSIVLGDVYSFLNPWRTAASLLGIPRRKRDHGMGVWPAVVALFGVVWLELASSSGSDASTLAVAAICYSVWLFGWMAVFGIDVGLETADVFTVLNRAISAISPFGRHPDGSMMYRGWARAIVVLPRRRGFVAFVVSMIGTVTYDGLGGPSLWRDVFGDLVDQTGFQTGALVGVSVVIGLLYYGAIRAAIFLSGSQKPLIETAASFAHTLIPIGAAYSFAHYFTLVLLEGQALVGIASDPLGVGWNLFGTAGASVDYSWLSPSWIWWIQVVAIVSGHIVSVLLAHDRSLVEFPPETAVKSQSVMLVMLVMMVALTGLGLFLLAG